MALVSFQRADSYEPAVLRPALTRLLEPLGGMAAFVQPGDRVLIKPNLLAAAAPSERVTTDPAVIEAVTLLVREAGGLATIADSPALDRFSRVGAKTGVAQVAERLGVELVELNTPAPARPPAPAVYDRLELAARALEADVVISLPKLKSHCQMLLTLGVKNLFGTVVAQRKAEWHYMAGSRREAFADLLLDIHRTVNPALTILDGVWGMHRLGPQNGDPIFLGALAASADALSLDCAVCRALGVGLKRYPLYRAALARGLVEADLAGLALAGDDPEFLGRAGFEPPELDSMDLLPRAMGGLARRYLASKPVQDPGRCRSCLKCAEICPAKCLAVDKGRARFDYDACIRCYCCQEVCPEDAISFRRGLLVRVLGGLGR